MKTNFYYSDWRATSGFKIAIDGESEWWNSENWKEEEDGGMQKKQQQQKGNNKRATVN